MRVENVSRASIEKGLHRIKTPGAYLVQISDPGVLQPTPKFTEFGRVLQLHFLDADLPSKYVPEEALCSTEQALLIKEFIDDAILLERDLVVHCHAGICRSGAVVEYAVMMGFKPFPNIARIPNVRLKTMLMNHGYT